MSVPVRPPVLCDMQAHSRPRRTVRLGLHVGHHTLQRGHIQNDFPRGKTHKVVIPSRFRR
jgi:hypothetical protein